MPDWMESQHQKDDMIYVQTGQGPVVIGQTRMDALIVIIRPAPPAMISHWPHTALLKHLWSIPGILRPDRS